VKYKLILLSADDEQEHFYCRTLQSALRKALRANTYAVVAVIAENGKQMQRFHICGYRPADISAGWTHPHYKAMLELAGQTKHDLLKGLSLEGARRW
jgi:hypothetical protein